MDLTFLEKTDYIMDAWAKLVAASPDALAMTDERHPRGLSRRQVDELSGKIYAWLRAQNIGREDFVLICMPRGGMALISILGIWKAGAAFTLVEDNYPPERIAFIKNDCGCKAVIDINTWNEILKTEALPGYVQTDIHDAAFAIYTSGTTGNPKGVLHEYGAVKLIRAASCDRRTGNPRLNESDRLSLITPLNFNASIRRFIVSIYEGCHLFVVSYAVIKNPITLKQYLQTNRITVLLASPSLLRLIGDPGPNIRQIQISSEPANGYYIDGPELVNAYAMSETGFPVTEFIIDKKYDECPVGMPNIDQIKVTLIDEDGNEVPNGEEGEIAIEDPFFREYINLPEQTQKALINGIYHSGDIGKKLHDGNIVLLGRNSDMIKINGNRIEPAEIEAIGKKVLGVDWCAARGFEEELRSFVCLYYKDDIALDEMKVRSEMEKYLPYYMIPAYFVKVDEVPLLPNGKMNRRALPKPESKAQRAEYEAPRTETERIICKAFEVALSLDNIGIHDNFYHLGGDSLGSMRVLSEADLPGLLASDIFEGCTPERIAALYEDREAGKQPVDIAKTEAVERTKLHPLTPNQISIFDYCIFAARSLMWNLPRLYRFPKDTDAQRLCDAMNKALANRTALFTVFQFNKEGSIVQRIAPDKIIHLSVQKMTEAEFKKNEEFLMQPFIMINEPLVHAGVYQTEESVYLFWEIHHIMTDGTGMHLLNDDIVAAWNGEELPLDTYYAYLHNEEELRESKRYREDGKYIDETYGGTDWCVNLSPDTGNRPDGRALIPLKMISLDDMAAFEKKHHLSRNLLFSAVALLGIAVIENKEQVMADWIFHDRTDEIKKNAFGCLFRYITIGLDIKKGLTAGEYFKALTDKSNAMLAHCSYEWSIKQDNVYQHDTLIVCYETSEIMSTNDIGSIGGTRLNVTSNAPVNSRSVAFQIIENADGILPLLMFNQALYSEEKIQHTVEVFSELLDRLMNSEDDTVII
ncbi:MAG: non-ribosomal peptide synthetase [Clostridiales bacterium]|nr:non-ribosomal peptide synthetase [Clostridiales bacterium]